MQLLANVIAKLFTTVNDSLTVFDSLKNIQTLNFNLLLMLLTNVKKITQIRVCRIENIYHLEKTIVWYNFWRAKQTVQ